jgi:hypothetical protein
MSPETQHTIQAIASAVSAIAAAVALMSLYLLVKQRWSDHDRSRGERAIELTRFWATALTRRAAITKKLVERLDDAQTRSLWKMEAFSVLTELEHVLRGCIPAELHEGLEKQDGRIYLKEDVVTIVRWEMVTYLNQLESILMASRHNIADRDLIEEQSRYLVKRSEGSYLLETFRTAAGGASS